MDLSIVILNYRTKDLLRECLRGLRFAKPDLQMEVIVVDNDSRDGSAEMVLSEFPEARLIRSPNNAGYAAGNNIGLKLGVGRYLMVTNPDIFVWPGSLEALVRFMDENPRVGLAGPQLTNPDGTIQKSCYRFQDLLTPVWSRTLLGRLLFGKRAMANYLMDDFDHLSTREVDWVLGAAMIARREAVADVGFLDETFFMYCDDTDWCRRYWEKNWRVVYVPSARLVHFHQRLSKGGVAELFRNRLTRIHVKSALTYFKKYRGKPNPRIADRVNSNSAQL